MTTICEQEQAIDVDTPEWEALAATYGVPAGADTDALLDAIRVRADAPRDVTYASLIATLPPKAQDQADMLSVDDVPAVQTGTGPGAPDGEGDEQLDAAQESFDPTNAEPDDGNDDA